MIKFLYKISLTLIFFLISKLLFSQTEIEPWGNLKGIRIDGQLMEFESNISVVKKDWSGITATGKEKQRPKYIREGRRQIVSTNIDSLYFEEVAEDSGKDIANINIQLTSKADVSIEGVFFTLTLPDTYYAGGSMKLNNLKVVKLNSEASLLNKYLQTPVRSIQFISSSRQLTIIFPEATNVIIKREDAKEKRIQLFIPIQKGDTKEGQIISKAFTIAAAGFIDRKPVILTLHTDSTGRVFDGFGGNFRLQNPKTDPQVIDYCLENLRVAWGRVEMPWRFWQPAIDTSPIAEAKDGRLNIRVQKAMEMAQRLYKTGMPVILTAWFPPSWAITGTPNFRPTPGGVWGNPLDHTKDNEIYKSIADYIVYLKEQYGVEIAMFSFNESDLGINIRQTGEEHRDLIKGLGAYFVSRELKTKLLLGDNSDATTYEFIYPALNDPSTYQYIGAVSFHSWRGWESETLQKWADAATQLNLPLIVGEGSIDAQAWGYPAIFQEQTYALEEINLYTRLLAICQPASILQWQLTADYSPLAGGGIFGDDGPLRPTQRFWNLKQLSSTPAVLKFMPIHSTSLSVTCAALGDNVKSSYTIHLVNNGATREVIIKGISPKIKSFRLLVTDKSQFMKEKPEIHVRNGQTSFQSDAVSYTTLISN